MRERMKIFLLNHVSTTWNGALPPPLTWALICWYLLRPFLKGA
jgi:hypothetical protein